MKYRLLLLSALIFVVFNGCKKDAEEGLIPDPTAIQYQNQPNLNDALLLEVSQPDDGMTAYYYGSTDENGLGLQVNSIVTRRPGSDTTFNFLLDELQRIQYAFIELNGVKDSKLHRWIYPSSDSAYYLILEKDWSTLEDSIIFFAAASTLNGEFESQVYLPRLSGIDEWLPGQAALADGIYTATGVLASTAAGLLGSTINPVLGAMGALVVFHAFFDENASAGEIESTPNPNAPPSPEPTAAELETDPCENSNMSITVGVDPGDELVALVVGSSDGPCEFHWSTGENGEGETYHSIIAPSPGDYSVMVESASGCVSVGTVTVEPDCQSSDLAVSISEGGNTLTAIGSGGEGGYTFIWNNGSTDPAITFQGAGTFDVTITDEYGCTAAASYSVGCNDLQVSISEGASNLQATATGGTAPYTVEWSNGNISWSLDNVSQSSYSVTVTDALGCTAIASINASGSIVISHTGNLDTDNLTPLVITVTGPSSYSVSLGFFCSGWGLTGALPDINTGNQPIYGWYPDECNGSGIYTGDGLALVVQDNSNGLYHMYYVSGPASVGYLCTSDILEYGLESCW